MLTEVDVRKRIGRESVAVVALLDFFAGHVRPFTGGTGWTVFNDWFDHCYRKFHGKVLPPGVVMVAPEVVRQTVFPVC